MTDKIAQLRKTYFPLDLGEGYLVSPSDEGTVRGFLAQNFGVVFPQPNDAGPSQTLLVAKEREMIIGELMGMTGYKNLHAEHFLFTHNGEPVGWSVGETMDFMTYYMRNTGILPSHQKKGIYSKFLDVFSKYIEEIGYERLTSQHKPDNTEMLITKLRAGFVITGMDLDERWGSLVRLTKFLKSDRDDAFKRCFGRK